MIHAQIVHYAARDVGWSKKVSLMGDAGGNIGQKEDRPIANIGQLNGRDDVFDTGNLIPLSPNTETRRNPSLRR
jgi:hypothetical protein